MKKIKQNVIRFLKKYQMDYLDVDVDSNIGAFLKEMKKGLAGKKSSLDMIPTYIEIGAEVPTNKRVIAIDAGGTNFRVATVYFDDQKKPVIENLRLYKMPGVQHETGKDEFFKTMAGYLKDVAGTAQNIGFCFSYPTEMFPNKDGRVTLLTKEVKAKQVQGQIVGENLLGAMTEIGIDGKKRVVILNDTVATLLAGKGVSDRKFSGYIGFILGTGTNCCYVEKNSNIKKTKDLDPSPDYQYGIGRFPDAETKQDGRCVRTVNALARTSYVREDDFRGVHRAVVHGCRQAGGGAWFVYARGRKRA
jgi:hexokinase